MNDSLTNLQKYLREIETEMWSLREAARARDEAAKLTVPSSAESIIGDSPVMHFLGPGEPFTLTVRQLETVHACWSEVRRFLWANHTEKDSSKLQPEPINKAIPQPRAKELKGWAAERAAELGILSVPAPGPEVSAEDTCLTAPAIPRTEIDFAPEPAMTADEETGREELPLRERPNYGISRIDQPEKANHGWYVRITKNGHTDQKFFADKSWGGQTLALEQARVHRDFLKEKILGIARLDPPLNSGSSAQPTLGMDDFPSVTAAGEMSSSFQGNEDEDPFQI